MLYEPFTQSQLVRGRDGTRTAVGVTCLLANHTCYRSRRTQVPPTMRSHRPTGAHRKARRTRAWDNTRGQAVVLVIIGISIY
eukprot:4667054-Prymnesium_polylepis.1